MQKGVFVKLPTVAVALIPPGLELLIVSIHGMDFQYPRESVTMILSDLSPQALGFPLANGEIDLDGTNLLPYLHFSRLIKGLSIACLYISKYSNDSSHCGGREKNHNLQDTSFLIRIPRVYCLQDGGNRFSCR